MTAKLAWLLGTCFGCGLFPVGPGTAGSIAAVLLALFVHWAWGWPGWAFAILSALLVLPAVWAARRLERQTQQHDPQIVVADEVLGQWIALAPAPVLDWRSLVFALLLFRFFDIVKPFPVRRLEALPGGIGIVADDLMAGLYAALVLFLLRCFNF